MNHIVADESGELIEREQQPPVVRILAHVISYVFHPLFIATYVTAFLLYIHPYVFAGFDFLAKIYTVTSVLVNTVVIPGFAIFLMWRLKLIQSIYLHTSRDRIIPYAATMIFYFWGWFVLSRQPNSPPVFVDFLQGVFFGVCGAWLINIQSKISMHTTAMGGLVCFFLLFSFTDDQASGLYLSLAILIAGLVTTARLIVSDHTRFQIVQGLVVGALAQLVAWWI